MIKLSIIIPAYNAEPYLTQLLTCLKKQLTDEIEVIIIDDGSNIPVVCEWAIVYRERNGSPGISRNLGLDRVHGQYFTFLDADDLVADNYVETILNKIESEKFDYCYLSWKTTPDSPWQCTVRLTSVEDKFPPYNLCVWNRVYKTSKFGKHRFNPKKLWSEDADYIYRLNERGKKSFISDFMYFYRSGTPGSWTKRMFNGELDYNRIVYNVRTVTPELRDEIIREYKDNEIVLLTNDNPYEELSKYAMIMNYCQQVSGSELRGDPFPGFRQIPQPYRTQVLIYVSAEHDIGGIETFVYNFCYHMHKYYDITILYDAQFHALQMERLSGMADIILNDPNKTIVCNTAINTRIVKKIPKNVQARQTIQMSHTCKMALWGQMQIPEGYDTKVFVSEASAKSFDEKEGDYQVIYNLTVPVECDRSLILVSASRPTPEKGMGRAVELAKLLDLEQIPYIWLVFTNEQIRNAPQNMIVVKPTLNIAPYLKMADYLVQLSDSEAFGYSMVEALEQGTPIITTPIDVLPEIGFEEGVNGYTVPFEVKGFDVKKLLNIPKFEYKRDNAAIVKQWRALLGNTKPTKKNKPKGKLVEIRVIRQYTDMSLGRIVNTGEHIKTTPQRAKTICDAGYAERV